MSDHLLKQILSGEFTPDYNEHAKLLDAQSFAEKFGGVYRDGKPGGLQRVRLEGCDYFWSVDTGEYDGWGRSS